MTRGRHRASFDQVSKLYRGRIVAYRDCGLSFREIGQLVGRNQATVMWICHRWLQKKTMNLRGRSHQPRCTTAHDNRWICAYGSVGSRSNITNHRRIDCVLSIIRSPLVPFNAVCNKVKCPQGVHCFVYP
ncbi:transposable element Tcb1 transposase [Trichonephila clavipes]|nr:transposable element Tcb1 transposase [Trichonephila clavipes]